MACGERGTEVVRDDGEQRLMDASVVVKSLILKRTPSVA